MRLFRYINIRELIECNKRASWFYVDFFSSPAEWKLMEAELMQKRFLVGFGPSLNTCPRCASHFEQVTSVRTISGFAISSSRLPPTSWRRLIRRDARFSVVLFFFFSDESEEWFSGGSRARN